MKLRNLEYVVNSVRAGDAGFTIVANHPDGEIHEFHAAPSMDGEWEKPIFISKAMISSMRLGNSSAARALGDIYRAIFSVHRTGIMMSQKYIGNGIDNEAALF